MTDKKIKDIFGDLQEARDVAKLLGVNYPTFIYKLYKKPISDNYVCFSVAKKSGGTRHISAPTGQLKFWQWKLNKMLQSTIEPKYCVNAFSLNKSIVTNAKNHVGVRYVLNVDLVDFFGAIYFGRIRGLLIANPFAFSLSASNVIAHICCLDGVLPQGAPTSPIFSNLICLKMDNQLRNLAQEYNCFYTRYADDLTFSFRYDYVPDAFLIRKNNNYVLGEKLQKIINDNGFNVNEKKVKLRSRKERQEVTGLVVNKKVNVKRYYIRQIRAMIYAWRKFGYEKAQNEYFTKYYKKQRNSERDRPSFKDVLVAKINFVGMVRGRDDDIYRKFCDQLRMLDYTIKLRKKHISYKKRPLIITEGTSDWKHLKAALFWLKKRGYFNDLDLEFSEYEGSLVGSALLNEISTYQLEIQPRITIFIADSDNRHVVEQVNDIKTKGPRYWGNNVYSFSLPVPNHRSTDKRLVYSGVSIELYYTNDEIQRIYGRKKKRLFLSDEFDMNTKKHKTKDLYVKKSNNNFKVLDANNLTDGLKYALTKNQFARAVLHKEAPFGDVDFTQFIKIFRIIKKIYDSPIEI